MIGHVYKRCLTSQLLSDVYVATCDNQIQEYIDGIGGKVIMTRDDHERCTDRTVEALLKIEEAIGFKADMVVMIQGDEPMVTAQMLDEAINEIINDESVQVVNLMSILKSREEHEDANEVKVVTDLRGDALYFSREPIPSWKKGAKSVPMMKQVCLIPFRRDFLLKYSQLEPTPLEIIESVDMMRILEHGLEVRMVETTESTYAVDTPEDLKNVERLMQSDKLMASYLREMSSEV